MLAVVNSCEVFKVFLLGRPFLLRTDHIALAAIFNSKLKKSSRVIKWVMRLQEFDFKVECIPGKENIVADALSRIPWGCVDSAGNELSEPTDEYEFDSDSEVEFPALPIVDRDVGIEVEDQAAPL